MRCDLCGVYEVAWLWMTPNIVTQEQAEAGEGWWFEDEGWLVCNECHELILADDALGLLTRAYSHMEPPFDAAFEHPFIQEGLTRARRDSIANMHRAFWTHKTTYERIED